MFVKSLTILPTQHAKQVCDEAEEALEEARRDAKKLLKCKEVVFRDIGTKDIFQVRRLLRGTTCRNVH